MVLKRSRLRRLNQRLTLAKYKIKSSSSRTLKSLVVVVFAKGVIDKSIMITKNTIITIKNQKPGYSLFPRASASQSELLNQLITSHDKLVTYYYIIHRLQLFLILFLFLSISNAIFESYSNNKY